MGHTGRKGKRCAALYSSPTCRDLADRAILLQLVERCVNLRSSSGPPAHADADATVRSPCSLASADFGKALIEIVGEDRVISEAG